MHLRWLMARGLVVVGVEGGGVVADQRGLGELGTRGRGAGRGPGTDGRRRAYLWRASGAPAACPLRAPAAQSRSGRHKRGRRVREGDEEGAGGQARGKKTEEVEEPKTGEQKTEEQKTEAQKIGRAEEQRRTEKNREEHRRTEKKNTEAPRRTEKKNTEDRKNTEEQKGRTEEHRRRLQRGGEEEETERRKRSRSRREGEWRGAGRGAGRRGVLTVRWVSGTQELGNFEELQRQGERPTLGSRVATTVAQRPP
ncbi:hypothetical protein NDU88_002700 [Pleurodeles waltl]|uniref:Uncharacterized protein n=1 Tax=Pleurodeles waltl TaxID=8319 RepID=A0AAV7MPN2_PLEWA|nr:hypothetical protein NDU88_002700 [Pleurodeles waltl]